MALPRKYVPSRVHLHLSTHTHPRLMDAFKQLPRPSDEFLTPLIESACHAHGITMADLVFVAAQGPQAVELMSKTLNVPCDAFTRAIQSLDQALRQSPPRRFPPAMPLISTGMPILDSCLNGGIPLGEITEIVGAAGTAKLHFAMQLSLQCQITQTNNSVGQCIYVTTEQALETRRLKAMLSNYSQYPDVLLDNIHHTYCSTPESMDHILYTQVPALLEKLANTKLLIIDSIAQHIGQGSSLSHAHSFQEKIDSQNEAAGNSLQYAQLQKENTVQLRKRLNRLFTYKRLQSKQAYLIRLHRHLTMLAKTFQIAIVVVNHVSDLVSDDSSENAEGLDFKLHQACHAGWDIGPLANRFTGQEFETDELDEIGRHVACMGNTWSKRIANRILFVKFYKLNPILLDSDQFAQKSVPPDDHLSIGSKRKAEALCLEPEPELEPNPKPNPDPMGSSVAPAPDSPDRDLVKSKDFFTTTRYVKVVNSHQDRVTLLAKIPIKLGPTGLYTC